MRIPFSDIFRVNQDGSVSPRLPVYINGITMSPGISFGLGISFGGFDIASLRNKDLEVERRPDGIMIIKGYFKEAVH